MVESFRGSQRKARWLLVVVVFLALLVPASAAASPASPASTPETVIWKELCPGTITIIPEGAAVRHVVCYDSVVTRAKVASIIWKKPCSGTITIIPEGTGAHAVCSVGS